MPMGCSTGRLYDAPKKSCFKQGFQECFCGFRPRFFSVGSIGVSKNEEIAEIALFLLHDAFRLRLLAIIVNAHAVAGAIQAAVQIRAAKGAGLPPADGGL